MSNHLQNRMNSTYDSGMINTETLARFLEKPVCFIRGTLSTADTVSTFNRWNLITDVAPTFWVNKLAGVAGIRFDAEIKMMVNASPFQQGLYMLAYLPTGGSPIRTGAARYRDMGNMWMDAHSFTLVQRSQLKHATIDISCDTEAVLYVPWTNQYEYYPTRCMTDASIDTRTTASLGSVQVFPYSALQAASGLTTCSYSLWVSLKNIQFIGSSVPQSDSAKEGSKMGMGPIESTSKRVSQAAKILSSVPLVGQYAGTVSWASDIIGNVAHVFGWSKPSDKSAPQRMVSNPAAYAANFDGPDSSIILAQSSKNEISQPVGAYGTAIDETSIRYLAGIYSYYQTLTFASTDAAAAEIGAYNVTPNFQNTVAIDGKDTYNMSTIAFLSILHKKWRGGIKFRFRFVKTGFHSGRLRISYAPRFQDLSQTFTANTAYLGYNTIVDLRQSNEVEVVCPYVSPKLYLDTWAVASVQQDSVVGVLRIFVEDTLIAPNTVASSIPIIVEVAGAEDFEVAEPALIRINPVLGTVPQSDNPCGLMSAGIGGSVVRSETLIPSQQAIGEKVISLRAISRRFGTIANTSAPFKNKIYVFPQFTNWEYVNQALAPGSMWTLNPCYGDYISLFQSIYQYSRGGYRLKCINEDILYSSGSAATYTGSSAQWGAFLCTLNGSKPATVLDRLDELGQSGLDKSFAGHSIGQPYVTVPPKGNAVIEVQVPAYSHFIVRNNAEQMAFNQAGSTSADTLSCDNIAVGFGSLTHEVAVTEALQKGDVFRAGSDDYDFGMFVSIPPMYFVGYAS